MTGRRPPRRTKRPAPTLPSRFRHLTTEAPHPKARDFETKSIVEIVALVVGDEQKAQRAAAAAVPEIARAVELVVSALRRGGRLFYVGAGTSGRIGALDAAELPPTFGSSPTQVVAVLAGGPRALQRAVEGAEDRADQAVRRLGRLGLGPEDVVCAIAASGITAFTRSALEFAKERGAGRIFVTCVRDPDHTALADVVVAAPVGPEVLPGSTRLKAGTATKLILNALSTATMTQLGKVYRGRMIEVMATNEKLRDRARRIVAELTGVDEQRARRLLSRAKGSAKRAIAMHYLGLSGAEVDRRLEEVDGDLRRLLADLDKS